jgi:hypothetical protein
MNKYRDILHLPRPVFEDRPRMSMSDRAAQFSPFAALTGYDAAVAETARYTEEKPELEEDEKELLNRTLQQLHPGSQITVIYFLKDSKKPGGALRTVSGQFLRTDPLPKCRSTFIAP